MWNWLSVLVTPVSKAFVSVQQRKQAKDSAKAKIKMAKQNNDYNLQMTDTEWEALGKHTESDSWKDEWVTLVITLPIPVIFLGAIYSAFTGDPTFIEAVDSGVTAILTLLPNFHNILEIVVYAAISIKGVSSIAR